MKVSRRGETVRMRLSGTEAAVLQQVLADLSDGIRGLGADDPVWQRLHPAAYADAAAAAEFRELVEEDVDTVRMDRIERCRADVADGATTLRLAGDDLDRWLRTTNELRLAIGTRLDVSADDDPGDSRFAQDPGRMLYGWLTWVQDELVTAAMG